MMVNNCQIPEKTRLKNRANAFIKFINIIKLDFIKYFRIQMYSYNITDESLLQFTETFQVMFSDCSSLD